MANIDSDTKVLMHFNESVAKDEMSNVVEYAGSAALVAQGRFNSAAKLDETSQVYMSQDLDLSTSDYTIDAWFRFDSIPNALIKPSYLIALGSDDDNVLFQFSLKIDKNNNGLVVLANNGALHDKVLTYDELQELGTNWFHLAFVFDKANGNMVVYLNGTTKKTITSDEIDMTNDELFDEYTSSINTTHYIDEFRISGVKRWTEDFTPNTREYGMEDYLRLNYRNTKALLHFNDSAIKDECQNLWGVNGIVSLEEDDDQYTKSLHLSAKDGNGINYIQLQDAIALGMNDFVVDFFLKADAEIDVASATSPYIFEMSNSTSSQKVYLKSTGYSVDNDDSKFGIALTYANSTSDTVTLDRGTSYHIAVVYDATLQQLNLYAAGEKQTHIAEVTFSDTQNWIFTIGDGYNTKANDSTDKCFTGNIDEFRVTVGIGLYYDDFSAPTTAYDIATAAEPLVTENENTIVFLPFDESPIKDDCGNYWKQIGGNLALSTAKYKFNKSLYIAEALNYIKMKSNLTLGVSDFTIDFFVNNATSAAGKVLFDLYNTESSEELKVVTADTLGKIKLVFGDDETSQDIELSASDMDHVAVIYNKITKDLDIYLNGEKKDTIAGVEFENTTNWNLSVGNQINNSSGATNFFGYIDQFRVTNTIAFEIESNAFTVPTTIYAVDGVRNAIRPANVASTVFIPLKLY